MPYDPRELLTGGKQGGVFKSGLLDSGSFVETLADWAKTVVVGRSRYICEYVYIHLYNLDRYICIYVCIYL